MKLKTVGFQDGYAHVCGHAEEATFAPEKKCKNIPDVSLKTSFFWIIVEESYFKNFSKYFLNMN